MNYLKSVLISALISSIIWIGFYQYFPLAWFDSVELGATITTIQGSDTLKASRAVINTNYSNLNTDKVEISDLSSTTTLPNLSTLAGLTTTGALASGSLTTGFTAVNVAQGGTGSTTLAKFNLLLGSTTSALGIVAGHGISGQFLTSNGVNAVPTWQTSAIDTTIDYNFTSTIFGVKNLHASSTIIIGGTSFNFLADGASSTVMSTDSSGNLTFNTVRSLNPFDSVVGATTTSLTLSNDATETTYDSTGTITLTGGTLGANGTLRIKAIISDHDTVVSGTAVNSINFRFKLGGVNVCTLVTGNSAEATNNLQGFVECTIFATGSDATQIWQSSVLMNESGTGATDNKGDSNSGTATIDTSTDKVITLTLDWDAANSGNSITITSLSAIVY